MTATTRYPVSAIGSGLTLYSLTNEWLSGGYDLESLLRAVADQGLGPGVEIVGFQSLRSFPDVDDATVGHWQGLLDELGLVPTCLGSNVDIALRSDRLLDDDEMVEYLARQLHTAARLGFSVVRIQIGASPEVIRRITPLAEDLGLRLGMELHAPAGPRTEEILRVRDLYASIGSPVLGFIPDFSATMHDIPQAAQRQWVEAGLPERLLEPFVESWRTATGSPFQKFQAFRRFALKEGADEGAVGATMMAFTMHGNEPMESWYDIADQIFHVHGKCYEFDAEGNEPSIDYPAIAKLLVDIDYHGYVSTEWEGHSLVGLEVDGFAMVKAHQALMSRSLREVVASRV